VNSLLGSLRSDKEYSTHDFSSHPNSLVVSLRVAPTQSFSNNLPLTIQVLNLNFADPGVVRRRNNLGWIHYVEPEVKPRKMAQDGDRLREPMGHELRIVLCCIPELGIDSHQFWFLLAGRLEMFLGRFFIPGEEGVGG
jgi:hypothetical protein